MRAPVRTEVVCPKPDQLVGTHAPATFSWRFGYGAPSQFGPHSPRALVKSHQPSTKTATIVHSYPRPPRERVTSNGPIESAPPPAIVRSRSVSGGALPIGI